MIGVVLDGAAIGVVVVIAAIVIYELYVYFRYDTVQRLIEVAAVSIAVLAIIRVVLLLEL